MFTDDLRMHSVSQFLMIASISQMLLSVIVLMRAGSEEGSKPNQTRVLFGLLLLCGAGYLLGQLPYGDALPMLLQWWVYLGSNALIGVFWLTVQSLFSQRQSLVLWQYLLGALTLVLPAVLAYTLWWWPGLLSLKHGMGGAIVGLELSLVCHGLYMALRYWQDDLVEQRRTLRIVLVIFVGSYLLSVILFEQVLNWQFEGRELIKSVLVLALVTGVNILLLSLRQDGLFGPVSRLANTSISAPNAQSPALRILLNAMDKDKLYLQEGLTIPLLANQLSIQEYKLRRLINGELNYRNFNDFLNRYRVADVAEKLSDPEYDGTPILTLALESGFRSLSSFNQAFRNIHQQTPSEYRKMQGMAG